MVTGTRRTKNPPTSTILCLVSKKQIQMINNTIMNWRWRALAQKIDPAMLASTVNICSQKIELDLLFAYGISEQMCRGWTRTPSIATTANVTRTVTRLVSVEVQEFP